MDANKPFLYPANPYGFSEGGRFWYYGRVIPMLELHSNVLDPWGNPLATELAERAEACLRQGDTKGRSLALEAIGRLHYETIRERADIVVGFLDGEPADGGTQDEMAWGYALRALLKKNITVIGYRSDFRRCGDHPFDVNLMTAAAIVDSGGFMTHSLDELESRLVDLIERCYS